MSEPNAISEATLRRLAACAYPIPLIAVLALVWRPRELYASIRIHCVQSLMLFALFNIVCCYATYFMPFTAAAPKIAVVLSSLTLYVTYAYCFLQTWRGREAHIPLLSSLAKICCAPRAGADTFAK